LKFFQDGGRRFIQDGGRRHLGFFQTENSAIGSAVPEKPTLEPKMNWSDYRLRRYVHLKISKMAAAAILYFSNRNSAIRSVVPEKPTIE